MKMRPVSRATQGAYHLGLQCGKRTNRLYRSLPEALNHLMCQRNQRTAFRHVFPVKPGPLPQFVLLQCYRFVIRILLPSPRGGPYPPAVRRFPQNRQSAHNSGTRPGGNIW